METRKKRTEVEYKIAIEDNSIKIYIAGFVHVSLKQDDLVGYQSWVEGDKIKKYKIEYYMKSGNEIITAYNTKEKWLKILKLLDGADLYSNIDR